MNKVSTTGTWESCDVPIIEWHPRTGTPDEWFEVKTRVNTGSQNEEDLEKRDNEVKTIFKVKFGS